MTLRLMDHQAALGTPMLTFPYVHKGIFRIDLFNIFLKVLLDYISVVTSNQRWEEHFFIPVLAFACTRVSCDQTAADNAADNRGVGECIAFSQKLSNG